MSNLLVQNIKHTNDTTAMTIDSSGNVGIGTASVSSGFQAELNHSGETYGLKLTNGSNSIRFGANGPEISATGARLDLRTTDSNQMRFYTNNAERMRVGSGGEVYIGGDQVASTDFNGALNVDGDGIGFGNSSSSYRRIYWNDGNTDMRFWNGSNEAIINDSGAFTDASDEKIKKDIADITYGIDVVKALKPRKYKMKATDKEQIGFIAQEVESHVPEVVTTGKNPDGVEQKGLAYGQITAVLTKALQEAIAKIEVLEAEVAKLKG